MDRISLKRIQLAHPALREELLEIVEECNRRLTGPYKIRIVYTIRSHAIQAELYAQGRTRPGLIVTRAKPGDSWHQYALAVDFCLIHESGKMASWNTTADFDNDLKADWMEVVEVFKSKHWVWGGDWPRNKRDMPHFQKTFGLTIQQAKQQYEKTKNPYITIR